MQRSLTKGPITGSILLFALPLMLGNLLQQMYNIADTWVVGRFLGADALAAVGSSYTLMTFLTSILLGLCMGSGAAISMQYGSGEQDRYLFIRGKVSPRIYNPSELEAKITSMMMLSEAQETLMKEVTVMVPVGDLTEELIGKLSCTVKDNRGKVMLRVKVYDPAADVAVNLYSKSVKVDMTGDMVRFLEDYALQYTLM